MKIKIQQRESKPSETLEVRYLTIKDLEVRQVGEEDENEVEVGGYAVKWDDKADIGGWFTESFKRGAFKETIVDDDQVMMVQHDSLPIARRSADTMSLKEDRTGLSFTAYLDTTDPDSNSVVRKIRRGDVKGVSVGFTMQGGVEEWVYEEGADPDHRTIEKVGQLFEISVVGTPAYNDAEIGLRSLEAAKKAATEEQEAEEERNQQEPEEPKEDEEEQTVEASEDAETREDDADSEGELETLSEETLKRLHARTESKKSRLQAHQ